MRLVLALVALALSASVAAAQPGMTPPSTQTYGPSQVYAAPPSAPVTPPPRREAPEKSESTARWAALGTTALGAVMIYAAAERESPELGILGIGVTIVGPSMGHVYAGETGRAVKMTLLRTAGVALFAYGASEEGQYRCADYCVEEDNSDGELMMLVGGAVAIGSALYDIYDAPRAARRTNAKHAATWQVAPSVMASQGRTMPAVSLSGSF